MNQQVSTGTIAAIILVVVVVLGIVAWRVFGTHEPSAAVQQETQQKMQQEYMQRMRGGGVAPTGAPMTPAGGARPGGP